MNGAAQTAQGLRTLQVRISMIDRTDVGALTDETIDDALAYIEVTPEIRAIADKAKSACRRFKKAFDGPARATTPRRHLIEHARQRVQCRVTELLAAVRNAPDSWVTAHMGDADKKGDLERLAARYLSKPSKAWSLGSFGAIAEFMWTKDEPSVAGSGDVLARVTPRGGILVAPPHGAVPFHYTTPTRHVARRRREIAFCLPRDDCAMSRRTVVTELGPDAQALREDDRDAILFDVGLGQLQVDVLVRTADAETLAVLRAAEGRSIFDPSVHLAREMPRLSPHRVFVSRCGRIEVYQPIPPTEGTSPDGPHTHVLPKLLRSGRTHAANLPIPDGLVPCLTIHLSRPDPDHANKSLQGA